MKQCYKCKEDKETIYFSSSKKTKDGLFSWCKACMKVYEAERYQNGDALRKKLNTDQRRLRNKEFVKQYLLQNPCVDCGDTDWWALDFDHKDTTNKHKEICYLISAGGIKSIQAEIDKCDVRCVKCHRKRTIEQFGWWRGEDFGNVV